MDFWWGLHKTSESVLKELFLEDLKRHAQRADNVQSIHRFIPELSLLLRRFRSKINNIQVIERPICKVLFSKEHSKALGLLS